MIKVPITTYADVSRRIHTVGIFAILGTFAAGMLILGLVGLPFAVAVRDFAGGNLGQALAIAISIPFFCLLTYLPIIALRLIDRHIGIRCPNCNVSLTLRSLQEKILITRKCSNCLSVVLTNEDYEPAPQPSRPWVVVPLLIVLTILIVCFVAAELSSPVSHFKSTSFWSETAIELFAFFVIARGYAMIMKTMKRRWESEAPAEECERQSE